MSEQFDLIIIGGGPGGYVAALRATQLDLKVAVVEKRNALGGTCLNEGCIPSKALLDSSELFALARDRFDRHGIVIDPPQLDLAKMLKRKAEIIQRLTRGIASLFKKGGITLVTGTGRLGPDAGELRQVLVATADGEQTLQAKNVLLASGSVAVELPHIPFDGDKIGQARDALNYPEVPEHLVVVGGGYIGLELGSVWMRLGAKVTVVEMLEQILPTTDVEVAVQLRRSLEKQGMTILTGTKVAGVTKGDTLTVKLEGQKDGEISCDRVLVATGRRPCIEGLDLEQAGITLNELKQIDVDQNYATSKPGVYAIGDLIHGPMLAHKAMDEGVVFVERLLGRQSEIDYDLIPGIMYTMPELAAIGATEEQLKERGIAYNVGKFPFMANGRARCMDEPEGMVKVLAAPDSGHILGVHIMGPKASELIAEAVSIMAFGGSIEDVELIMHPHPTLSEAFKEAALAAAGKAVHA
ncbi:MAG: dihydrolipoyl dehydrogenase [Desulfuromonadales bacterium]|nr:dihydrolipoyl dehydrogenase [Desulfuromonadales bacterium]